MSRVVQAARGWIGTPYVHQASCKGAGCDCLGLIRGLWRELCGAEPELPPAYTMDWSEPQGTEALWQAAARHLTAKPLRDAAPGDVILFRMREGSVAKHLGVQSQAGSNETRAMPGRGRKRSARPGGRTGTARPIGQAEVVNSGPAFIHAYAGHGVVESPLSPPWQRRIVARFHFPKELN
ncbi:MULTISPECIES: NlpC/P60 family protein [Leisingera]|jgi:NlpC/P60 family putative phage cell wall peptidase|uniref:Putative phage cell wall peptidase, NlpC/P60 family n=1 Tax=Leisingera aquaemixtae TaxID=1396826 RepID=A0A0P1HC26_9RHOB|nr:MULTISPECIES: NlpC/P60 family protein [Leisingera]QDI75949.1 peptidase [Leisingera aquaemixtae]CUI00998.1 putative phage cell wall peptidase, NlpC/P60 family [Leisingera aquaemixtae]